MAVSITTTPEAVVLAKNPVKFSAESDDPTFSAGSKAKIRLGFDPADMPADGDAINVEASGWGFDLSFLCDATPSSATSFLPPDPGESVASFIASKLIPALMSTATMYNNYIAYQVGNELHVEAIEEGATHTFGTFQVNGFAPAYLTNTPGTDGSVSDVQIRFRVILTNSFVNGTPTRSEWMFLTPDADGSVTFDVSDILTRMWNAEENFFLAASTIHRNILSVRHFQIEVAEHQGATPWATTHIISTQRTAIMGGLATIDKGLAFLATFANRWLTHRDGKITLQPQTIDNLHFYGHSGLNGDDVEGKAKVYYTDGTTNETVTWTSSVVVEGGVYSIPCGFNQLNLHLLDPAKEAYKYEVWVEDGGGQVMTPKTFLLRDTHFADFQLHFRNSFGLMETIQCEGARSLSVTGSRKLIGTTPPVFGPERSTSEPFDISTQGRIVLSTGPLTSGQAMAAEEVLLSNTTFLTTSMRHGQQKVKCQIQPGTIQKSKVDFQGEECQVMSFTITLNREHSYSAENLKF